MSEGSKRNSLHSVEKAETVDNNDLESTDYDSSLSSDLNFKVKTETFNNKIITDLTPQEQKRYEIFRRSNFLKGTIKKYINQIIGQAVNPNIIISVCGLSKVFIGELVVESIEIQKERGHKGPLQPFHIHEAMRRLYKKMPNLKVFKDAPWNKYV